MNHGKEFFLYTLGVVVPDELCKYDITVKRSNESKPFCTIFTNKNGKAVLRVNPWEEDGIVVTIP